LTTISATRQQLGLGISLGLIAVSTWALLTAASIGAVLLLNIWAIMIPVYALGLVIAIWRPGLAALLILMLAIALEPSAADFSEPIASAFWQMPPTFENAVWITTSPLELLTFVAAISALLTRPSQAKIPAIAWAVPGVIVLGLLYGSYKGGPPNLAYSEARGLLVGIAIFVLAIRVLPERLADLIRPIMFAESVLAASMVLRYLIYVRGGSLTVPTEFAFSHEGSIILGVGLIVGLVAAVRAGATKFERVLSVAYCLLILAAMVASGRRAATLVIIVGAVSFGLMLLPRRPMLVVAIAIPVLLAFGAYLGAYWNKEYGALAQPARAVRSQFDPSLRDESSDQYRAIEKYDVIETIRLNRPFGVGFGRQFSQFQPLPNLEHFWSLQYYTPHQSVLWLWLKMGVFGISAVLGFAVVAISRCLRAAREAANEEQWGLAAISLGVILMFLMYSTVDLGFVGPRGIAPAVIACAIAFSFEKRGELAK
jgi:O-antigen ligase